MRGTGARDPTATSPAAVTLAALVQWALGIARLGFVRVTAGRLRVAQHAHPQAKFKPRGRATRPMRQEPAAPASPSRGPGNGILRAETGGRIQAQNAQERSEFGSQTATCLTNRPELRGFPPARKPPRFADCMVGDAGIKPATPPPSLRIGHIPGIEEMRLRTSAAQHATRTSSAESEYACVKRTLEKTPRQGFLHCTVADIAGDNFAPSLNAALAAS